MPRTILMGDPTYFSVLGGANPHTRNVLGMRKAVDADRARRQWHELARTLVAHGVEVCVVEAHQGISGLVYPANAGFLFPLEQADGGGDQIASAKHFYLANLLPSRAGEREVYRPFIESMGYLPSDAQARFEGEADFFPASRYMLFTYGVVERQRFVPRLGLPPWKRVYGFRSDRKALDELRSYVHGRAILPLELRLEAHYHGDTVLCSFGPQREFLLAYLDGLTAPSRERLHQEFRHNLIPLSEHDAAIYAANSFQSDNDGKWYLFMPEGVSDELLHAVSERGVEPVLANVSEFLNKGGGSIKCMILDLGPSDEQPSDAAAVAFRAKRSYAQLFPDAHSAEHFADG
jgi:N-dimethylarginine dimethylaminohydrolase